MKEILETVELLPIVFKGRVFTASDLVLIREVVSTCSGLSRQELANTACELLDWRRPTGGLKALECKELLARLEAQGFVELPALLATKPRGAGAADKAASLAGCKSPRRQLADSDG